jgi:inositol-phosphate phosphatase/L-galactose 1-phosphate phosphatase/histidinol-phosphatase
MDKAFMYSTTPHMFSGENEVAWKRVRDGVRIPLYGCDCYAYGLLAAGQVDLVVEADLKPYDYMALVPIIQASSSRGRLSKLVNSFEHDCRLRNMLLA